MTDEEILANLKNLCDGALKMGLISKIEDAAMLHEMFLLIQKRLSEPAPYYYNAEVTRSDKQLQSPDNNTTINRGLKEDGVREPASY